MKGGQPFDFIRLLKLLEQQRIRYLLIGRWAVAQHGAPVVTADYDLWVHPNDRRNFLRLLETAFEAELPDPARWNRPLVTAYVGPDKIDCFSPKKIVNDEGEELLFDRVYARAEVKKNAAEGLVIRVPHIDDLIALKKFSQKDPLKQARTLEDIRYLQMLKASARKRKGRGGKK
jgi:hypothetical protein